MEPAPERTQDDLLASVLGYDRLTGRTGGWLAAGAALLLLAVLFGLGPASWRALDRASWLGTPGGNGTPLAVDGSTAYVGLYAAAYVLFVAPALVLAALMLAHRWRHGPRARLSNAMFVAVHAVAMVQAAFVSLTFGDPTTSRDLGDRALDAGLGIWAADTVERGWLVGLAALVLVVLAAVAAGRVRHSRQVLVFLVLLVVALATPWLALGTDYVLPPTG
ncbi:hypothetical protein [Promicromonospora sp. NPDC050262]|uniref:hypothetical protein n=1 Tax=Promicromonospora sp. NPDC050262 TaxID=3155036 RepID=UPI0033CA6509